MMKKKSYPDDLWSSANQKEQQWRRLPWWDLYWYLRVLEGDQDSSLDGHNPNLKSWLKPPTLHGKFSKRAGDKEGISKDICS